MYTPIRTKLCTAVCCAFVAAAISAFSTSVEATEDVPSKTVRFDDLDITKTAGAKALLGRIRAAARDVCELSTERDPIMRPAVRPCMEKAIDQAVRKVNAPALTALRFGSDPVRLASK
jgi:UrcA family protein